MNDPTRHARQLRLAGIGVDGQERLRRARVVVVGCGGLGAPVIAYLAGAGVGRLDLFDDDTVELSNLNRQVLFATDDVGKRKAEVAARFARALDPSLDVRAHVARVTTHTVRDDIGGADLVVDASDGLPTKYLLNDACVAARVPLVHGAVTAWSGQVLVVHAGGRPCLRCVFPTLPAAGTVPTCQTVGVLGAACGVVGSLMASLAVRVLVDGAGAHAGKLLSVDVEKPRTAAIAIPVDELCRACGTRPDVDGTVAEDYEATRCD